MNVTLQVPSGIAPGAKVFDPSGAVHTVAADGTVSVDRIYQSIMLDAGFAIPQSFQAVNANVTANANGAQANGTQLSYGLNQIATAAAAAASVLLPVAVPGQFCTVENDSANAVQVFGNGSDTVNSVAAATGIAQPPKSVATYWCAVAGQWRVNPGAGFNAGVPTFGPAANGIASNGTNLADSTPLTARINRVTTVGAANGAVVLPAALPGDLRIVTNVGANTANVFPVANEFITPGAANASVQIAANKTAIFSCGVAGKWDMVLTA